VTSLPVLALGGVQAQHARSLRAAGAVGLAVVSAVFGSPDPAAAVSELLTAWDADH
jgi:thiamine-phosphate pyrophosphorylase